MSGDGDEDEVVVTAKLQNARFLLQFLKAINFKDEVTLVLEEKGLKLTVEDSKSFQANAFIQRELFQQYEIDASSDSSEVSFRLYMPSLIDCLGLFGLHQQADAVLCLKYSDSRSLQLWLEESGVVTEVLARVRRAEPAVDFGFNQTDITAKVILQAEHLRDLLLCDLESCGNESSVEVTVDSDALYLSADGASGKLTVEVPRESPIVAHFQCTKDQPVKARYRLPLFRSAMKPVGISEKVSLRMDERDVLCLQYMIKVDDQKSFLEFLCVPEES